MILDSPALVSILFGEPDAARMARCILNSASPRIGAPNWLEVAMVTESRDHPEIRSKLDALVQELGIEIVPFDAVQAEMARDAHLRFGQGKNRLNYGDCMAYALAASSGEPLLFKGNDFANTDIVSALP